MRVKFKFKDINILPLQIRWQKCKWKKIKFKSIIPLIQYFWVENIDLEKKKWSIIFVNRKSNLFQAIIDSSIKIQNMNNVISHFRAINCSTNIFVWWNILEIPNKTINGNNIFVLWTKENVSWSLLTRKCIFAMELFIFNNIFCSI